MRKLLLLLAASAIVIGSCTKNTDSNSGGPYTCQCSYGLVTGAYYRDTTTATTYSSGTTKTDADSYCATKQDLLTSTTGVQHALCNIR